MDILEILLGQLPEAIFFAIYLILVKNLKKHRVGFALSLVVEYMLLITVFQYNWLFHVLFMCVTYFSLKLFYKKKAQITDIFVLLIGYIILGGSSILCYGISMLVFPNLIFATILNRIVLVLILFCFRDKFKSIQKLYKKYWNRDNKPKQIKTTTFRGCNLVLFSIVFTIINICLVYSIYLRR